MAKKKQESTNSVVRLITFFKEAWAELKKVHPPTRTETWQATRVVLVMFVLIAVFLGLADYVVGNIMKAVLT